MMERHEHTNPWADKLQEVPLPDANDSWSAMEILLDKEMPLGRHSDKRRWLLLILLLLLLIGVCNCPRQGQWNNWGRSGSSPASPSKDGQAPTGPLSGAPIPPIAENPLSGTPASHSPVSLSETHTSRGPDPGVVAPETRSSTDRSGISGGADSGSSTAKTPLRDASVSGKNTPPPAAYSSKPLIPPSGTPRVKYAPSGPLPIKDVPSSVSSSAPPGETSSGRKNSQRMKARSKGSPILADRTGKGTSAGPTGKSTSAGPAAKKGILKKTTRQAGIGEEIPEEKQKGKTKGNISGRTGPGPGTGKTTTTPVAIPGTPGETTPAISGTTTPAIAGTIPPASTGKKGKDSTAASPLTPGDNNIPKKKPAGTENKKLPENKKPSEDQDSAKEDVKGLVAGIGFNQFFSVGQQQKSDYNSGGTTGGIGDYIPIPMIRYYFSRKLFVQLEAQFNTPQYTKKDLVAGQSTGDTLSPGLVQQNSVVIKKLFYFNLPLSVHYSPIKNLYVGAGLQYSRLSNGVGLYENKVLVTGGSDTVKSAKIYSFKGDSIYQKMRTNEFRFLVDLSYTYKRFIIGARYNQALSKFLNTRLSNTQVTQARNSSLQLYIRYILWDGRKRKGSSPK